MIDLIWYLEILFAQPQGNVDGRDKKQKTEKQKIKTLDNSSYLN